MFITRLIAAPRRVTGMPWEKTAKYTIVAARMPDSMRRHALQDAGLESPVDVFSPGNNAWILKQDSALFVLETRSCEGFARLDKAPESGLGTLMGRFAMQGGALVFNAAPKAPPPAAAAAESPAPAEATPPVKN